MKRNALAFRRFFSKTRHRYAGYQKKGNRLAPCFLMKRLPIPANLHTILKLYGTNT